MAHQAKRPDESRGFCFACGSSSQRETGFRRRSRENRFAFQAKPSGSLLTRGSRRNIARRAKSERPTKKKALAKASAFFNDIRSLRSRMIYPDGYDVCFADDIRFAYDGNGYHIMLAAGKYIMRRQPYIISRKRYFIKKPSGSLLTEGGVEKSTSQEVLFNDYLFYYSALAQWRFASPSRPISSSSYRPSSQFSSQASPGADISK